MIWDRKVSLIILLILILLIVFKHIYLLESIKQSHVHYNTNCHYQFQACIAQFFYLKSNNRIVSMDRYHDKYEHYCPFGLVSFSVELDKTVLKLKFQNLMNHLICLCWVCFSPVITLSKFNRVELTFDYLHSL